MKKPLISPRMRLKSVTIKGVRFVEEYYRLWVGTELVSKSKNTHGPFDNKDHVESFIHQRHTYFRRLVDHLNKNGIKSPYTELFVFNPEMPVEEARKLAADWSHIGTEINYGAPIKH